MERKYLSEAGLDVFTSYKTIIPIEGLKELEKIDNHKYHIYAILSYPQIYFNSEKTYVGEDGIYMCLFNPIYDEEYILQKWDLGSGIDYSKVVMKYSYPYEKLEIIIDEKKGNLFIGKTDNGKTIEIKNDNLKIGEFYTAIVTKLKVNSLIGEILEEV